VTEAVRVLLMGSSELQPLTVVIAAGYVTKDRIHAELVVAIRSAARRG